MYLVGLTGGIASGKSTVSARFADVHGFPVVDADQIAREVVEPGEPALAAIVERFGPQVLAGERLDRPALGRIVFADPAARADLGAIVHPAVGERTLERLAELADHHGPVIHDVPLLVENDLAGRYPAVVLVAASRTTRHQRLVELRGMDREEAWQRIDAQASEEERSAVATHVIHNEGSLADLHARVDEVAADLRRLAG